MIIFESVQKQIDGMDDIRKNIVKEAIEEMSFDIGLVDYFQQLENLGIDTSKMVSADIYKALELDQCVSVFDIIEF